MLSTLVCSPTFCAWQRPLISLAATFWSFSVEMQFLWVLGQCLSFPLSTALKQLSENKYKLQLLTNISLSYTRYTHYSAPLAIFYAWISARLLKATHTLYSSNASSSSLRRSLSICTCLLDTKSKNATSSSSKTLTWLPETNFGEHVDLSRQERFDH